MPATSIRICCIALQTHMRAPAFRLEYCLDTNNYILAWAELLVNAHGL